MMPCYYWFAKLIKKAGCALGTFSGAPRVGCGEMDVARVVQHKRQHYTPPYTTFWTDNRVSPVRGSFSSAAIRTVTGGHFCSLQ